MKKVFIVLFICLFTSNANAGLWTFAQATSAKHRAQEAKTAIEETQTEVNKLKIEVNELKERIEILINLMEKENEEKESKNKTTRNIKN